MAGLLVTPVSAQPTRNLQQRLKPDMGPYRKPNVVLILADDIGYGDLGCYGQTKIKTPNLDLMAAQGTRFTQFYAGGADCFSSRASLLTGLHNGHTSVRGGTDVPLAGTDVTLAAMLDSDGYRSGLFGEWLLGDAGTVGSPEAHGFGQIFGWLKKADAENFFPATFTRYSAVERPEVGSLPVPANTYSQDWLMRGATNYMKLYASYPFFLYLASPIARANEELAKKTGNGMEVPNDAPYHDEKMVPA